MVNLVGFLCWVTLGANEETPLPDIASIENQVLNYRRSLQRGHVIFTQKTYEKGIHKPLFDRVTTVWFDGKKVRNDDLFRYTDGPVDAPLQREVTCRNCEKDGYWVDYNDMKVPQGELGILMTHMAANPNPKAFGIIHPRLLGMVLENVPNFRTARAHLESIVGRPDRKNLSIHRKHWKGRECLQISYKSLHDADIRIWISPDQGPSVVRMEREITFRGEHYFRSAEVDLHQFMPSGLWYPQSFVYERRINAESVEKEVTEVQVLSLNEPVSPGAFTLAGMNIPVGKPVGVVGKPNSARGEKGGFFYWNGKELVPKTRVPRNQYISTPSFRTKLLIINAVFFALIAAYLLWNYWRKRKAA